MYGYSARQDKLYNPRCKRQRLAAQCGQHGIPATMGNTRHYDEHKERRVRTRPTTIGEMRRRLQEKNITPCC